MHDPSSAGYYQAMVMKQPQFPEQEQLKCPRCDSTNTKFCYYNNYNLSQPRHFCKSCRRYWTKGGALRNIPVGGGSRKNTKRSGQHGSSSSSSSSSSSAHQKKTHIFRNPDPGRSSVAQDPALSSSFIALDLPYPASNPTAGISSIQEPTRIYGFPIGYQDVKALDIGGSFSSLLGSNMPLGGILEGLHGNGSGLGPAPEMGLRIIDGSNGGGVETDCWSRWTDLSMNTGGSSFQ